MLRISNLQAFGSKREAFMSTYLKQYDRHELILVDVQNMVHWGNGYPSRLSLGRCEFDSRMNRKMFRWSNGQDG